MNDEQIKVILYDKIGKVIKIFGVWEQFRYLHYLRLLLIQHAQKNGY